MKIEEDFKKLKAGLIKMGRELAANQWYGSGTFEPTIEDRISSAVAAAKAEIGEKLLEALDVKPICRECDGEGKHKQWCSRKEE